MAFRFGGNSNDRPCASVWQLPSTYAGGVTVPDRMLLDLLCYRADHLVDGVRLDFITSSLGTSENPIWPTFTNILPMQIDPNAVPLQI